MERRDGGGRWVGWRDDERVERRRASRKNDSQNLRLDPRLREIVEGTASRVEPMPRLPCELSRNELCSSSAL